MLINFGFLDKIFIFVYPVISLPRTLPEELMRDVHKIKHQSTMYKRQQPRNNGFNKKG